MLIPFQTLMSIVEILMVVVILIFRFGEYRHPFFISPDFPGKELAADGFRQVVGCAGQRNVSHNAHRAPFGHPDQFGHEGIGIFGSNMAQELFASGAYLLQQNRVRGH